MKCDLCVYLETVLKHLKEYDDIEVWRHCKYPLPYHVYEKAIPMGVEHNCKCFSKSHVCKHVNCAAVMYPDSKVCSLYEVYCKDCNNFVDLLSGKIINDKSPALIHI